AKPKLVVGIVVDQMRWDYLYRFQPLFSNKGGFKRFLNEGFTAQNTYINYTPSVTACGHASIYTGTVPNIHGITGNAWFDTRMEKNVYCTEDKSVTGVGTTSAENGQMSPKNMQTTSITDELRLNSNFKSKVIGIALKDRGAILPAGHSANGAYWYDTRTGKFVTSTFYTNALPNWVDNFNNRKLVDSFYALGWKTLLDTTVYTQYATADEKPFESRPFGKEATKFPYNLSGYIGKDYGKIATTPWGNTITALMAKEAIVQEQLGKTNATDFLAVSFSSPDYIGHSFGPDSWEMVDDYVRLDAELGNFFEFLDAQLGRDAYTVFLTADHGVAHVPGYLKERKIPAGAVNDGAVVKQLNDSIAAKWGITNAIASAYNYQISFSAKAFNSKEDKQEEITEYVIKQLLKQEGVANAFAIEELMEVPLNRKLREMLANGYYPGRSGSIQIILKPGYIDGGNTGTTHGLWNPYDTHIPCLWYGWGIQKGQTYRETYMTDIAPTIAALLNIQVPNGSIGTVITEALKK
ncbi:MAG: alkaline phosphatase family protein, partial [Bacteroidetes bacterium]